MKICFENLRNLLRDKNQATGREAINIFLKKFNSINKTEYLKILDIGCGEGESLYMASKIFPKSSLYGIGGEKSIILEKLKVNINSIDLDCEKLPYEDSFFDLIIINHVAEHLKNIFLVFREIRRCLKPNGVLIIGVPNMAAWHNRIALLFGWQPFCSRVLSGHVRGFVRKDLTLALNQFSFKVLDNLGDSFYGVPNRRLSTFFARRFPDFAGTIHLLAINKKDDDNNFNKRIKSLLEKFDTNYIF